MQPDDKLCYCFHVSQRKVVNFLRVQKPRVASELSGCGGAGTGCGWCVPFLKKHFQQWTAAEAIEESLRFNTSAQRFRRTATRAVELHGQVISPGETVVLAYGAANRDERKFPQADRFDIDRNPRGHLGFGAGKHFCIGSSFARLVTDTAMNRFLDEIPEFTLARRDFDWVPSSNFRSPVSLPLARR